MNKNIENIESIQISLFFKNIFEGNYFNLANEIKDSYPGSVVDIPGIPDELPLDIPRLQATLSGSSSVGVSKNRVDLFFKDIKDSDTYIEFLHKICESMNVVIYAVANVTSYVIKKETNLFIDKYFKEDVSKQGFENVLLRFGKKIKLGSVDLNQNVTCQSGLINKADGSPTEEQAFIVTIDTNTIGLEKNNEYDGIKTKNLNKSIIDNHDKDHIFLKM